MPDNIPFLLFHAHDDIKAYKNLTECIPLFKSAGITSFFVEFTKKDEFGKVLFGQIKHARQCIKEGVYPDGYDEKKSEHHVSAMEAEHTFFLTLEASGFDIVCVDTPSPAERDSLSRENYYLERIVDDNLDIALKIQDYLEANPTKKAIGLFGSMHCILAKDLECKGYLLSSKIGEFDVYKSIYPYICSQIQEAISNNTLAFLDSNNLCTINELQTKRLNDAKSDTSDEKEVEIQIGDSTPPFSTPSSPFSALLSHPTTPTTTPEPMPTHHPSPIHVTSGVTAKSTSSPTLTSTIIPPDTTPVPIPPPSGLPNNTL